ncbi:hypothetical protein [Mycolicibacterium chubuense]|uniref:Novel STAND NTPase 5 domain-containing protein n=1 Tax=Mycolicibacterium chubuense TaxID=1800 RepID=A0A0J6VB83_MYCCU|nr:hypothetical protein [Mycolicibacterium chubuense]KMO66808.1 hypothetical protein MCHUDSM44219_05743 [Mycolicibacterium chubuense]SPX98536.1 Uncharacterised protein [Mycolicibacterium chubuense]
MSQDGGQTATQDASDTPTADAMELIRSHFAGATVELIRPLSGGKSGAQVLLIDLTDATQRRDGQYVAKVQAARTAHGNPNERFRTLGAYTLGHTPEIPLIEVKDGVSVELYDLAGFSTKTTRTFREVRNQNDKQHILSELVLGLISDQFDVESRRASYDISPIDILQEWLGEKFWTTERYKKLSSGTSIGFADEAKVFLFAAELLPNPISIISELAKQDHARVGVIAGLNHGDLHTANILVQGSTLSTQVHHWIIDANWADESPLLYDYSYLEVSLILDSLSSSTHLEILSVLRSINKQNGNEHQFDLGHTDLISNICTIRDIVCGYLEEHQQRRADVWQQQLLLSRIAAGLNWASKPMDANQRSVGFLYACWALRDWLTRYLPDYWQSAATIADKGSTAVRVKEADVSVEDGEAKLRHYWELLQSIPTDTDLIIVTGRVRHLSSRIETLATMRIAAVVDLDPDSDTEGLLGALGDYLRVSRRLNVFGSNENFVSTRRSTNWLMANGWSTRSEATADEVTQWRRGGYLARVRRVIDSTVAASTSRSVYVLSIRDETTRDMALRVLEYIDETYSGIVEQIDLSATIASPFSVHRFVDARENAILSDVSNSAVRIPGSNGRVEVDVVTLHRYEADLELLHDQILTRPSSASSAGLVDEFWRGRPPTWDEIAAGIDIRRQEEATFIDTCRKAINEGRSTILRLDHSPGAGATTLVRRVAWELMTEMPVALVSKFGDTTGELIAEISTLADLPVLVFAESAVVSESDRDALFESITGNHGKATIVWINRTTSPSNRAMQLIDPMTRTESASFIHAFSELSQHADSRADLQSLLTNYDSQPKQFHSPFYYGLTAFERDFNGIEDFVTNHLHNLGPLQIKIAQYLALVTRFSQVGLYPEIVRRWLGRPERPPHEITDEYLVELLGADLRHLVVSDGFAYRLLHPIIADGVLSYYHDKYGQLSLAQISVRLIEQVHDVLGESSEPARSLLRSIFITRSGEFRRDGFSELVGKFSPEEGQLVFEKLTDKFPNEPHFWNHRGRFHIYKVRGDYETAESYLERAVDTASANSKGTHLHTLGMVRRLWVERQIATIASGDEGLKGVALIEVLRPTYDSAMTAFQESRTLGSGSNYSWVTPIQLTNTVVEFLIKQSGASNLHELLETTGEVSDWVADQMHQAESLLDVVRVDSLERTHDRDYYVELSGKIDALYGDVDTLIEQWQSIRDSGAGNSATLGCSMARAVFSSSGRSWAHVDEARARQLAEMLQPAVDSGTASDADLRTWIQAYRRLPEYSSSAALERVTYYASERNSVDGAYYAYVLSFQLWANGGLVDQNRVRHYLDLCKRSTRDRRQDWSYEWISVSGKAEIVHFSELGRWTRDRRQVWSQSEKLGRVRGVIEDVDDYRSGYTRVGKGTLTAFFAPQGEVLASRDINERADFYLGFSYSGLRGWSVKLITDKNDQSDSDRSAENLEYSRVQSSAVAAPASPKSIDNAPTTEISESAPVDTSSLSELDRKIRAFLAQVCHEHPGGIFAGELSTLGNLLIQQFGVAEYRQFKSKSKTLHAGIRRLGFELLASDVGYSIKPIDSY